MQFFSIGNNGFSSKFISFQKKTENNFVFFEKNQKNDKLSLLHLIIFPLFIEQKAHE